MKHFLVVYVLLLSTQLVGIKSANDATPLNSDPVLDWVVGPLGPVGWLFFEQVVFRCNVNTEGLDPDYDLLDIAFLIGDQVKKEFTSLPFDELPAKLFGYEDFELIFNESRSDKLAYNKLLRCDARTRLNGTSIISATRSVEQYYGFNITNAHHLVLEEEGMTQIDIHLNLPVLEILGGSFVNVELQIPRFYLDNSKGCSDDQELNLMMAHTQCLVEFDASHDPQTKSLQVVGLPQNNYFQPREIIIKLASTISRANRHISDFPLEPTAVTMVDKKRDISYMMCYAILDPNMLMFSDHWWYIEESPSEFILYKHDTLKYEVQIKTELCEFGGTISCPCGVIVRAGLSGYIFDTCGPRNRRSSLSFRQAPRIKMYDCADGQQDMEIDRPFHNYYIFTFPTKTRVEVYLDDWFGGHSVYVYPSVADINSSGGVCGRITKFGTAERVKRDGSIATDDFEFANSWRVDPEERLFTEQDLAFTTPVNPCGVAREHDQCINEKTRITGQENEFCQQKKVKRKRGSAQPWKRSIDEQADVMEDNNGYIEYEEENVAIPEPVWKNGWTEGTAREYCDNFLKNNPAAQACRDLLPAMQAAEEGAVNTCIRDIKMTGDTDAASIQLRSLLALCMMELEKDTDLWEADPVTGEYTIPTAVTNSVCPSQCNGRGNCLNGACECSTGFSGADCSFNDTAVPDIFRLPQDGLCDLQDWTCSAIKVYAYDAYDTPTLECKTTLYWVRDSGMEERETLESAGQWDRLYTVICSLPNVEEDKPHDVIGKMYRISLSNDGVRYGNEGSMMVFDGRCVGCSVQEDGHNCTMKAGVCSIDGSCYNDGEEDPSASCQFCDHSLDKHAWTQTNGSCVIEGSCYLPDEGNPTNACQLCQPQKAMTSWTPKGNCSVADIVFVLDYSGSIGLPNWLVTLDFVKTVISSFTIGDTGARIGLVTYGHQATVIFYLWDYDNKADLLVAVGNTQWLDQPTNTSGGIRSGRRLFDPLLGDRAGVPNIMIVVTDGESNRDAVLVAPEAEATRDKCILVFALGIGDDVNIGELNSIANKPLENFQFQATDFDALAGIRQQFVAAIRQQLVAAACDAIGGNRGPATATDAPLDACSIDRGGCDQYCTSLGPSVTCVCSDSFVLSPLDDTSCDDPCEKDNGGCSQLCSVSNHHVGCGCYDGYMVNPDDDTLCIEKNECLNVTCRNGASCVDLMNRFFCECVDDWSGETCDQKGKADPVVVSMHPDQGPVAGGTRITLIGKDFIHGALLTLGQHLQCYYNMQDSNSTVAILTTPGVRTEEANKALGVTVRFPGYEALEPAFTFTYRANPKLQSIYPLQVNVIGGTSLTVMGEALDIVSDPRLEVTMVHTYAEMAITKTNKTLYYGTCDVKGSTSMNCLAPKVDTPPAFRNWDKDALSTRLQKRSLFSELKDGNEHSRARRYPRNVAGLKRSSRSVQEEADLTIVAESETLDFYLGFRLDGVPTYRNLSDTRHLIDYGKISYLTEEPDILPSSFVPFVPNSGATISIKGSGFTRGFQPSDYRVAIGSGWCTDVDVTDNEISCSPPDQLPDGDDDPSQRNKRGTRGTDYISIGKRQKRAAREVEADVIVHAGTNLQIHAGTITYLISETTAPPKPNRASISTGVAMVALLGLLTQCLLV